MIKLDNIIVPLGTAKDELKKICISKSALNPHKAITFSILKHSIDARRKNDIKEIYSVMLLEDGEQAVRFTVPRVKCALEYPPIIVGFGPAGIFAAHTLALGGCMPIVLERGADIDHRAQVVDSFWQKGDLSLSSNAQFGEGGAGAFSDGKLNTGTHNRELCDYMLQLMIEAGAPEDIAYESKPHVGTDKLRAVVKKLREDIIAMGGNLQFNTMLEDIAFGDGFVDVTAGGKKYRTAHLIMAIGHSARDTYEMLFDKGVAMQAKPFAVGVRIEHLQKDINKAMYGESAGNPALPPADYKQVQHTASGGVYTFCMCPGGYVIAGSSEKEMVVTNGMSYRARAGANANSAVLVGVDTADFGADDALAGVRFQRKLERQAYILGGGGYKAPCQCFGDYVKGRRSVTMGKVEPSYKPGVASADINKLLPARLNTALKEGIFAFGRRLRGFDNADALITGVESRTSAPLRIMRGADYHSVSHRGVYPCGEGSGYAGGIMSAGVDGISVALAIIEAAGSNAK